MISQCDTCNQTITSDAANFLGIFMQAEDICPVLDAVASKTMLFIESLQFHLSSNFMVSLAMISPAFPVIPLLIDGTPRSFVSFCVPTAITRRSSYLLGFVRISICFISQCSVSVAGAVQIWLPNVAMPLVIFLLDLSVVAYQIASLPGSPLDS